MKHLFATILFALTAIVSAHAEVKGPGDTEFSECSTKVTAYFWAQKFIKLAHVISVCRGTTHDYMGNTFPSVIVQQEYQPSAKVWRITGAKKSKGTSTTSSLVFMGEIPSHGKYQPSGTTAKKVTGELVIKKEKGLATLSMEGKLGNLQIEAKEFEVVYQTQQLTGPQQ